MSGTMRFIRLPAEVVGMDKKLQIRRWTEKRKTNWDSVARYQLVDDARALWVSQGQQALADDPVYIVETIVKEDEQFLHYVVDELGQDISDPAVWAQIATAYAWIVIASYHRYQEGLR